MKLSIVTVSFNSERTIADTLRSVALQTHPDIEHIIVDGGSRDGTLALIRSHGAHVAKLVSEPDAGIYDGMNKGLRMATGDMVGFLNADDMLAGPDACAQLVSAASASIADAVYADLVYVDAEVTTRVVRRWSSGHFNPTRLRFGWMPPHPTFYVRRTSLAGQEFDASFRIAADYDFMLRVLQRPGVRVAYVPEVLVRMRTGGASNRSLAALLSKSSEDLEAIRRNGVGGVFTLLAKNLRKLPQFIARS